jgi:hypothetical protein
MWLTGERSISAIGASKQFGNAGLKAFRISFKVFSGTRRRSKSAKEHHHQHQI